MAHHDNTGTEAKARPALGGFLAVARRVLAEADNPPSGNTGGILCHPTAEGVETPANAGVDQSRGGTKSSLSSSVGILKPADVADNTPPVRLMPGGEVPKPDRKSVV